MNREQMSRIIEWVPSGTQKGYEDVVRKVASYLRPHEEEILSDWLKSYRELLAGVEGWDGDERIFTLCRGVLTAFLHLGEDGDFDRFLEAVVKFGKWGVEESLPCEIVLAGICLLEESCFSRLQTAFLDPAELSRVFAALSSFWNHHLIVLSSGFFQSYRQRTEELDKVARDLRVSHERLQEIIVIDELTGIYNRRYLGWRLPAEVSRAKRYGRPLACLMLDIDHFKRINDTYGHLVGDYVLQQLGRLLRQHIRTSDIPVRYGGEEFVILTPDTDATQAVVVAERLRVVVETKEFSYNDLSCRLTISAGVAGWTQGMDSANDLIQAADNSLYKAKQLGRNVTYIATQYLISERAG